MRIESTDIYVVYRCEHGSKCENERETNITVKQLNDNGNPLCRLCDNEMTLLYCEKRKDR